MAFYFSVAFTRKQSKSMMKMRLVCYWSSKCILTLSLNECFEVYHARTNITKKFGNEFDSEWLHIFQQYFNLQPIREEKNILHILNIFSSIFSLVCWFFFLQIMFSGSRKSCIFILFFVFVFVFFFFANIRY